MFKFGCNFQKWLSVIYNTIQSAVMNGGRMTDYFEITRGVTEVTRSRVQSLLKCPHSTRNFGYIVLNGVLTQRNRVMLL